MVSVPTEKTNQVFPIVGSGFQANQQRQLWEVVQLFPQQGKPSALFAKENGMRSTSPSDDMAAAHVRVFGDINAEVDHVRITPCIICDNCVPQESILVALREMKALRLIQPINNWDRNCGHILQIIVKL